MSALEQLDHHELESHVRLLGLIHLISNGIFLVIGAFLFMLLTGIGVATGEREAMGFLTVVGTSLAGLMALLGLPGMLAGYGLLKRKSWARILAIVVGVLGLPNFPVGTAIGLYTIWVLFQKSATDYF